MKDAHAADRPQSVDRVRHAVRTAQRHARRGPAGTDPVRGEPCVAAAARCAGRSAVRARRARAPADRTRDQHGGVGARGAGAATGRADPRKLRPRDRAAPFHDRCGQLFLRADRPAVDRVAARRRAGRHHPHDADRGQPADDARREGRGSGARRLSNASRRGSSPIDSFARSSSGSRRRPATSSGGASRGRNCSPGRGSRSARRDRSARPTC